MEYTKDQRDRMITKLRSMKNGEIFKMNKNSPSPIECKILRTSNSFSLLATELNGEPLLTVQGKPNAYDTLSMVVDTIQDWVNDWDAVLSQYRLELAKKRRNGRISTSLF